MRRRALPDCFAILRIPREKSAADKMEVDDPAAVDPELQSWLNTLPELEDKLNCLLHTPLPTYPSPQLSANSDSLLSEAAGLTLSRQQIKDLIGPLVDSSTASLSELCKTVRKSFPELPVSLEELKEVIHELASRIAYGVRDKRKDVYEDEDLAGYWAWQVDAYPQPPEILKERKLIGKSIQALSSVLSAIKKKVTSTQKPNVVKIKNQYDEYNKATKKLEAFRVQKNEKKRKRETSELEKSAKKLKLEQEREEKKAKLLEERQRAEAEKKAKVEAERKAKAELSAKKPQKEPPPQSSSQQRTLAGYFSMEKKAAEPRASGYRWVFGPELSVSVSKAFEYMGGAVVPDAAAGLQAWTRYFKLEVRRLPRHSEKFIYHGDSALKPYFVGIKNAGFRVRRNPFLHYSEVDYEKDSDEEFEELVLSTQNAEDIASSCTSSEESEDAGSEEEVKWIVPDGYLSQDECTEEEGAAPVREEYVGIPSLILQREDEKLAALKGFSISNAPFPVSCEFSEVKDHAPLNIEDLRRIVNENPYKKDQIIIAYKTLHPDTPKSQIRRAIETYFLKEEKKGGKKRYVYKDEVPAKPPVFIITKA